MPTVATFNIRHCRGLDGRVDVERVAAALRATQAELVALQEVDRRLPRSGRVDQPAELAQLTGLEIAFFPTLRFKGGEFGLALASPEPLGARLVPLPGLPGHEPRSVIVAPWGGFTVVALHLSNQAPARRVQLGALARLIGGIEGPLLVLGDFNEGRRRLKRELRGLEFSARRSTLRWRAIDHIAVRRATVSEVRTVRTQASDHLPLVAAVRPTDCRIRRYWCC